MTADKSCESVRACVFDAYGTVFDLSSAIRKQGAALGPKAEAVAQTWRTKQLEYAWISSLAGRHVDFLSCTERALDYALCLHDADRDQHAPLLAAYRQLDPYPDARPALAGLLSAGVPALLLSNGSPPMLDGALRSAGLVDAFVAQVSVEEAGVYKPSASVYRLAAERLNMSIPEIGFVSSNAWDVYGALTFGFRVVWVNRSGSPDEYGLRAKVLEAGTLTDAISALLRSDC